MSALEISPMEVKIAIGALIWLFLVLVLLFHRFGAEIVAGTFFVGAVLCMILKPTSEAIWIFLLSGLMFYSYSLLKKKAGKPLAEKTLE